MLELAGIHAGYENRDVLHGLSFSEIGRAHV